MAAYCCEVPGFGVGRTCCGIGIKKESTVGTRSKGSRKRPDGSRELVETRRKVTMSHPQLPCAAAHSQVAGFRCEGAGRTSLVGVHQAAVSSITAGKVNGT